VLVNHLGEIVSHPFQAFRTSSGIHVCRRGALKHPDIIVVGFVGPDQGQHRSSGGFAKLVASSAFRQRPGQFEQARMGLPAQPRCGHYDSNLARGAVAIAYLALPAVFFEPPIECNAAPTPAHPWPILFEFKVCWQVSLARC
jgi:hypothetical protein